MKKLTGSKKESEKLMIRMHWFATALCQKPVLNAWIKYASSLPHEELPLNWVFFFADPVMVQKVLQDEAELEKNVYPIEEQLKNQLVAYMRSSQKADATEKVALLMMKYLMNKNLDLDARILFLDKITFIFEELLSILIPTKQINKLDKNSSKNINRIYKIVDSVEDEKYAKVLIARFYSNLKVKRTKKYRNSDTKNEYSWIHEFNEGLKMLANILKIWPNTSPRNSQFKVPKELLDAKWVGTGDKRFEKEIKEWICIFFDMKDPTPRESIDAKSTPKSESSAVSKKEVSGEIKKPTPEMFKQSPATTSVGGEMKDSFLSWFWCQLL